MIRYLLDTDTLSYLMKKNHEFQVAILQQLLKKDEGSVAISVISVSEISRGIEKIKDLIKKTNLLKALDHILCSIIVLEFTEEAAWLYGDLRNNLCESGQDIGIMDTLIASHALSQKLILVSNNVKHFSRIPKLNIENWTI